MDWCFIVYHHELGYSDRRLEMLINSVGVERRSTQSQCLPRDVVMSALFVGQFMGVSTRLERVFLLLCLSALQCATYNIFFSYHRRIIFLRQPHVSCEYRVGTITIRPSGFEWQMSIFWAEWCKNWEIHAYKTIGYPESNTGRANLLEFSDEFVGFVTGFEIACQSRRFAQPRHYRYVGVSPSPLSSTYTTHPPDAHRWIGKILYSLGMWNLSTSNNRIRFQGGVFLYKHQEDVSSA